MKSLTTEGTFMIRESTKPGQQVSFTMNPYSDSIEHAPFLTDCCGLSHRLFRISAHITNDILHFSVY